MATARPNRRGATLLWVSLGAVGLLGAGAAFLGLRDKDQAQPKAAGPLTRDVAMLSRGDFDITTTSIGELEARTQTELRNELERQTTIVELAPEGKLVSKGDVVVRLNADEIQTQVSEEDSKLKAAQAEMVTSESAFELQKSENESKLRQAVLKLDLAELALQQWLNGEVETKRQELTLQLDSTQKELERLEDKVTQSKDLHNRGYLAKDLLQQDEISLRKARADRDKARLADETYWKFQYPKDEKQKKSDVEEAKAELERVKKTNETNLATKDAARENARAQVSNRQTRLDKLKKQVESATIRAPRDGLVVYSTSTERWRWMDRPLAVGVQIFPNQDLVFLPDTSDMVASVKVHESLAERVKPGLPVTVKVDALASRSFQGEVESVGVLAEANNWRDPNNREYTVKVKVKSDGAALKPAMRVEAQIQLGKVTDVLKVPIQAVFSDGPVRFVYVPKSDKWARRPVRLGARSDTMAQIKAGLNEGERVLLRAPTPAESLQESWTAGVLSPAGYALDDKGQPIDTTPPEPTKPEPAKVAAAKTDTPQDEPETSDESMRP